MRLRTLVWEFLCAWSSFSSLLTYALMGFLFDAARAKVVLLAAILEIRGNPHPSMYNVERILKIFGRQSP